MTDEEEAYPLKVEGNSPFPWANCVQWTTLGCRLVVVECHRSSNIFKLESSDLGRLQMRRGTQYSDVMSKLESLGASESAPEQQIKALMVPERAIPAEVWLDIEENVSDDAWEQAFSFSAESELFRTDSSSNILEKLIASSPPLEDGRYKFNRSTDICYSTFIGRCFNNPTIGAV